MRRSRWTRAALAAALLATPLAARAQIQLAPPLTPSPPPAAPPAAPPPAPPASPSQQEPPPLPLVFPPGAGGPEAGAPAPTPTAPSTVQPQQPPASAGPAPLPPGPNPWVPAQAAQLRVMNKIDSRTHSLSIKAGQSATVGSLTIAVKSCEVRPPNHATDATAWLDITDSDPKAVSFHGWMLAREPAVSVLQSPVYDVRLTGCT